MPDSEKFAIAARLHVVLRRKRGRVIDVEWMVRNREYAAEVLRLARAQDDAEVLGLVARFEAASGSRGAGGRTHRSVSMPPPLADLRPSAPAPARNPLAGQPVARYAGGLR